MENTLPDYKTKKILKKTLKKEEATVQIKVTVPGLEISKNTAEERGSNCY